MIERLKDGERSFITSIFNGVEKVAVSGASNQVTDMYSSTGEQLELWFAIPTMNLFPEVWLKRVETNMKDAVKHHIIMTYCDMDQDCPKVPEEAKELKKYKATT